MTKQSMLKKEIIPITKYWTTKIMVVEKVISQILKNNSLKLILTTNPY